MSSEQYRCHWIDADGQLQETEWIVASSDAEAMANVKLRHPGGGCEVWQGARLVGTAGLRSDGDGT